MPEQRSRHLSCGWPLAGTRLHDSLRCVPQRLCASPRSITRSILFSATLLLGAAGWLTTPVAQAQAGTSYGLFGSPRCADWAGMSPEARTNWTRAFISALSKGYEEIRRAGKQKFSNSEGVDQVVDAIDRHCASSPKAQAADAIAPFLN